MKGVSEKAIRIWSWNPDYCLLDLALSSRLQNMDQLSIASTSSTGGPSSFLASA